MNRIAAALVIAAGTALACASFAGEGFSGGDTEDERIRQFNAEFSGAFDRSIARFKDACEANRSPDQQLSTIEAGVDALIALVGTYEKEARELWSSNHILLLTMEDLLYESMVFARPDHSLADLARTEDLADKFVSYYKYMNNIGDDVEARDFRETWARDMAEGLACLDR